VCVDVRVKKNYVVAGYDNVVFSLNNLNSLLKDEKCGEGFPMRVPHFTESGDNCIYIIF